MSKFSLLASFVVAGAMVSAAHGAGGSDGQFSATMVQTFGKDKSTVTRLFVGKDGMRREMEQDGNPRIMIFNTVKRIAWMLNPKKKEYVEMKAPKGQGSQGPRQQSPLPDEPGSPCQTGQLQCKKLGMGDVYGRPAEVWEMTEKRGDQSRTTKSWFDKTLRMPIREEFSGGFVRELRDIKPGPQPPELFMLPAGYKKIALPAQQPREGSQTQQQRKSQQGYPPRKY